MLVMSKFSYLCRILMKNIFFVQCRRNHWKFVKYATVTVNKNQREAKPVQAELITVIDRTDN